jgi:hypothetical protein
VGLRYVFSLPVAVRANWVFQAIDRDGSAAWLSAVERFVIWCGIAPVIVASLPAAIAILGWVRAAAATVLTGLAALLWFEVMFRRWQKLPFAGSYLPGKKPVVATLMRYGLAVPLPGIAGHLMLHSSGDPAAFAALCSFEIALWWRLRARRRSLRSHCDLCYEETPEAAVMSLGLQPAGDAPETASAAPAPGPLAFSGTLVESRGLLPQAWAEEIAEDRRHPFILLETFLEDVRYGLRLIGRNPLLSLVVVLTLTVGIGINTSVFIVINGLALRPHVYKDPDSFVRVVPRARFQNTIRRASYSEYLAYRDGSRTLRELAAYAHFPAFIGEDHSEGSAGMTVSCNFFLVEGLDRAILGRLLTAEDCRSRGQPVLRDARHSRA